MTGERLIDHITSPTRIFEEMRLLGCSPNPLLGQHFLIDRNILDGFVHSLKILPGMSVLEIGPGLGHLTRSLVDSGARVLAVEKDKRLAEGLAERLGNPENLTVWEQDILEVNPAELRTWAGEEEIILTGNLPYYCSSTILGKAYEEWFDLWERAGFLLQEEVVDRIVSPPGGKAYGRLSILAQMFSVPHKVRRVPAYLFIPEPEVSSAWCVLVRKAVLPPVTPLQIAEVSGICFAERRKTLQNNLSRHLGRERANEILHATGIDGRRRAETLNVEEFVKLAEEMGE